MYPRPRARNSNNPVEVVDANDLAEACEDARLENSGVTAAAILVGPREWTRMKRQVAFWNYFQGWPGGEETFCGVPVVTHRTARRPQVMATQQDLEDALLGRE